jgi:hypothetical protein
MRMQKSGNPTVLADVSPSRCGHRREKLHISLIRGQSIRDRARTLTGTSRSAHISGGNSLALVVDRGSRSHSRGTRHARAATPQLPRFSEDFPKQCSPLFPLQRLRHCLVHIATFRAALLFLFGSRCCLICTHLRECPSDRVRWDSRHW